jgi:hypothetical protein
MAGWAGGASRLGDHGSGRVEAVSIAGGEGSASACSSVSPPASVFKTSVRSAALEVSPPVCAAGVRGRSSQASSMHPAPMRDWPVIMASGG